MATWREVSEAELQAFVASRPDLECTPVNFTEPPSTTWQPRDGKPEALAKWWMDTPDSDLLPRPVDHDQFYLRAVEA